MKITKTLLIATLVTGLAFTASKVQAESCDGGSLKTGENGHVYCLSDGNMNWWSAYTWCEAQGRHLATMYEICPTWDGSRGSSICNVSEFLNLSVQIWTATAYGENRAFKANAISDNARTDRLRAFCY